MKLILICMRLADMALVHPEMVVRTCEKCDHQVGVYPSGQRAMASHGGEANATLLCQVCHPSAEGLPLAPGARSEPFQSVPAGRIKKN